MNILYESAAIRFLKGLPRHISLRIHDKIKTLQNNPLPKGVKTIVGHHGLFRLRIGQYRVLYRIANNNIIVVTIDKRSRIY